MNENSHQHTSVLQTEAVDALNIKADGKYVDATFGRGGHSSDILSRLNDSGRLLAIDKDPDAISFAKSHITNDHRFTIRQACFSELQQIVDELGWHGKVNGVLFDLGVSSPQIDNAERGFSFKQDGPLDMRMDTSKGQTAAQWLVQAKEEEISKVLKEYGEEKFSRRIAKAIKQTLVQSPIETTRQLATLIASVVPSREKKDPATRSFQAIRIFINSELDEVTEVLRQLPGLLAPAGRIVVISFHSLEDRIVKRFFQEQAKGDNYPPGVPVTADMLKPVLKIIGKPIKANEDELSENIRSRSAIMRVAELLQ